VLRRARGMRDEHMVCIPTISHLSSPWVRFERPVSVSPRDRWR
jgi:hypothetical protein